ncbi:MAG: zinc ribbon domain-containing protein [Clostridia bacterium]|nr:zinc ribbon domain-containing protein [Clostridia bacterium]
MQCHQCGTEVEKDHIFCSQCGARIHSVRPTPQVQQPRVQSSDPQWGDRVLLGLKRMGRAISNAFFAFLACFVRLKYDLMQKLKK